MHNNRKKVLDGVANMCILIGMENTELAYNYQVTCRIMDERGYSMGEIEAFLIEHQNESGYIKSSLIPTK